MIDVRPATALLVKYWCSRAADIPDDDKPGRPDVVSSGRSKSMSAIFFLLACRTYLLMLLVTIVNT